MNDDVINHFKIGYAPLDNTRSIKVLRERFNCSVETLEKAGILANSGSGFYDRYRDRIMFPLENTKGDIVGFQEEYIRILTKASLNMLTHLRLQYSKKVQSYTTLEMQKIQLEKMDICTF